MTSKALSLLKFVADRAKQPSTWSALGVLALLTGNPLPAVLPDMAVQLFAGLSGALGVLLNEKPAA